ncbi:uncharacterized protein FFB20_09117 [Fusarium fujikuroi]|uniref:Uncharacterized protein n=1 Tax=Gibberella fujikuroi (strain CBS 195.34 / IMI 58289 / NRRL A-6831) TaxID=1279085 RepID=S0EP63_GIBF5|nr:uncharacterized protein FFUJ_14199 [Fusarium fujikuroi IMI 58289]KLO90124.1 uncharacterized protein Y057_8479 [Fusarium fujikuroi]CCT76169.1 uncharacterized protein FFUJ_14199 [Fusarium fujikuroi IMI 58289]SCN91996.1 uncharacterized protein FFB20_09117 [Fusarium fujikuroi]SCO24002.1 uncharacterized protein FFE2_15839 [Fusarium fujikuroi]SCO25715.1 uncharacterized protein FFC1_15673 [Fusarium fujikuroi]
MQGVNDLDVTPGLIVVMGEGKEMFVPVRLVHSSQSTVSTLQCFFTSGYTYMHACTFGHLEHRQQVHEHLAGQVDAMLGYHPTIPTRTPISTGAGCDRVHVPVRACVVHVVDPCDEVPHLGSSSAMKLLRIEGGTEALLQWKIRSFGEAQRWAELSSG